MSATAPTFAIVVPSSGRASLDVLLAALDGGSGPVPERVVVVDDRREPARALATPGALSRLDCPLDLVRGPARGPAAARNAGWRACAADWVAFLDDDVVPGAHWREELLADLAGLGPRVAGSQGALQVPPPADRAPTDDERAVLGLADAAWATADMAYRREALQALGGFDERFGRAYREDADLALRALRAGWELERGARRATHPLRADEGALASVRRQRGNEDDRLMAALHGRGWREEAGAPAGALPRHVATVAAAGAGLALAAAGRRVPAGVAGALWAALTARFALARIAPGPRTPREVGRMVLSSALIPPAAVRWALAGVPRARRLARTGGPAVAAAGPANAAWAPAAPAQTDLPAAILLDRDGTLVHDVPYNGDPDRVELVAGAREALDRARALGVPLGLVSNQSGIARGLLTPADVRAVNDRLQELVGPLDTVQICPHGPEDGCACRKPAPGLVVRAAEALGVDPAACVVIGDIGADVGAARAAGARGILVPTDVTRREEVEDAREVASSLAEAIDVALAPRPARVPSGASGSLGA